MSMRILDILLCSPPFSPEAAADVPQRRTHLAARRRTAGIEARQSGRDIHPRRREAQLEAR